MKRVLLLVAVFVLLLPAGGAFAKGGFDEAGYNDQARLFNGFLGYYDHEVDGGWLTGTQDAWLNMKWSKNWTPMEDEPVGAWVTNHYTWYTDDASAESWYGWDTRAEWTEKAMTPDTMYRVESFTKIMKVSDDAEAWAKYEAAGAYSVGWGTYENGVPKYIAFHDTVKVYEVETGKLVDEVNYVKGVKKGLGQPVF